MTRDEFSAQYKLLGLLRSGEGPTYSAEHRPSGRAVLVHFLPLNSPTAAILPDLIARLGPADAVKITETLTVEGSPVVVSGPIDSPGSFEQWLRARAGLPAAPPRPAGPASGVVPASASSVIPAVAAEPAGGGEFTQLFRSAEDAPIGGEGRQEALRAPEPAAPAVPGSFTALFQPAEAEASRGTPDRDAPRWPEPAVPPAPGGFTQMFQPPDGAGGTPPGGAAGPSVPMRSLRVSSQEAADLPPPLPPPEPPRLGATAPAAPIAAPIMRGSDLPAPPPLVPRPAAGPQNRGYVLPTMVAPEPRPAPMPPAPIRQGPSDYTRIVAGAAAVGDIPAAPAMPAAPPAAAGPARGSYVPLFVALNVVLILATGLVVYFALKRC